MSSVSLPVGTVVVDYTAEAVNKLGLRRLVAEQAGTAPQAGARSPQLPARIAAPAAPGKPSEVGQCRPAEAELCKMPLPGYHMPPGAGLRKLPEAGQGKLPEAGQGKLLEVGQGKLPEAERGRQSVLAAACRQRTERPINDCKGTGIWERREARRVVQSWCWTEGAGRHGTGSGTGSPAGC